LTRRQGRIAAHDDGKQASTDAHRQHETIKRADAGEPPRSIARSYNVHGSTISRLTF
jgi:hypothetical protein